MNHYQLIFAQRHHETQILQYQLLCNGRVILPNCGYQEGYAEVARRMTAVDTFQEIEGNRESKIMTYPEMLEGHFTMKNAHPNKSKK